jgi:hypothetical protein
MTARVAKDFWTNPWFGAVSWPIATAVGVCYDSMFLACVSAFFAGVSFYRLLVD